MGGEAVVCTYGWRGELTAAVISITQSRPHMQRAAPSEGNQLTDSLVVRYLIPVTQLTLFLSQYRGVNAYLPGEFHSDSAIYF